MHTLTLALLLIPRTGPAAPIDSWPQWRGPTGDSVVAGGELPTRWGPAENVVWKAPVPGWGNSTPAIWGDALFLTTQEEDRLLLMRLDRRTGKVLWTRTAFEGVPKIKRHLKGSQANCTPATDGKRVVACFGPEGLYCYDFDGKLLWKQGRTDALYLAGVYGGRVVLVGKTTCRAFRLSDGKPLWRTGTGVPSGVCMVAALVYWM